MSVISLISCAHSLPSFVVVCLRVCVCVCVFLYTYTIQPRRLHNSGGVDRSDPSSSSSPIAAAAAAFAANGRLGGDTTVITIGTPNHRLQATTAYCGDGLPLRRDALSRLPLACLSLPQQPQWPSSLFPAGAMLGKHAAGASVCACVRWYLCVCARV
eukprot:GHVU01074811.1.p3 GENE.GHVU01074811.1~~GHVU01074811.1.p3  ORF type:complete len:157 (+),score=20.66 GHVU01074811.1:1546-2016(+)